MSNPRSIIRPSGDRVKAQLGRNSDGSKFFFAAGAEDTGDRDVAITGRRFGPSGPNTFLQQELALTQESSFGMDGPRWSR